jgi:uncharacterized membrane protein
MKRADFMRELDRGLRGLPVAAREEILADYERYFSDGLAAGRADEDIAHSLGRPARLAAELILAHDMTPSKGAGVGHFPWRAIKSLSVLLFLDALLWLPVLIALLLLLVLAGGGLTAVVYGIFTLGVETFDDPLGGVLAALLRAVGLLAGGAGLLLLADAGIQGLAWFLVHGTSRRGSVSNKSNEVSS